MPDRTSRLLGWAAGLVALERCVKAAGVGAARPAAPCQGRSCSAPRRGAWGFGWAVCGKFMSGGPAGRCLETCQGKGSGRAKSRGDRWALPPPGALAKGAACLTPCHASMPKLGKPSAPGHNMGYAHQPTETGHAYQG